MGLLTPANRGTWAPPRHPSSSTSARSPWLAAIVVLAVALVWAPSGPRPPPRRAVLVGANVTTQLLKPLLGAAGGVPARRELAERAHDGDRLARVCVVLVAPPLAAVAAAAGALGVVAARRTLVLVGSAPIARATWSAALFVAGAWTGLVIAGAPAGAAVGARRAAACLAVACGGRLPPWRWRWSRWCRSWPR